jgi:hypothetical protein
MTADSLSQVVSGKKEFQIQDAFAVRRWRQLLTYPRLHRLLAPARAAVLAEAAVELTPDPWGSASWRRRMLWIERLAAAGELERVRRLWEAWAAQVPAEVRGQLTVVRADVDTDYKTVYEFWRRHLKNWRDDFPHLQSQGPMGKVTAVLRWRASHTVGAGASPYAVALPPTPAPLHPHSSINGGTRHTALDVTGHGQQPR